MDKNRIIIELNQKQYAGGRKQNFEHVIRPGPPTTPDKMTFGRLVNRTKEEQTGIK